MEESMLLNKLGKEGKNIKLKLLYKATIDSDRAEIFHKKCDRAKSSLVFIETIHGMRFGGFTTQSWEGDGIDKKLIKKMNMLLFFLWINFKYIILFQVNLL